MSQQTEQAPWADRSINRADKIKAHPAKGCGSNGPQGLMRFTFPPCADYTETVFEDIHMASTDTAPSFKQQAHALIDRLPDGANWKDLAYEASIIQDIEEGLADSHAGRVTENNEVRHRFGLPELPE